MAITRSRASNSTTQQVADATWTDILPLFGTQNFQGCEELVVQNTSGSAGPLKVCVASRSGIATGSVGVDPNKPATGDTSHRIGVAAADTPDDWMELAVGESMTFAGSFENKIVRAMVSGSGATANCKWSITKP